MNRFDEMRLDIYDAWACGLITESERDVLFLEMKTRTEYSVEKFKSKYKYNDSKEEVKKYGYPTITVDGDKYCVDMSGKPGEVPVHVAYEVDGEERDSEFMKNGYTGKAICSITRTKDGLIILPPLFFDLKNMRRRDAVLRHEVGHIKMHSDPRYNRTSPESAHKDIRDANIQDDVDNDLKDDRIFPIKNIKSEEKREAMITKNAKQRHASDEQVDEKRSKADPELLASRDRGVEAAKKYKSERGTHMGIKEYEADRYAANRTSESDVKKAYTELRRALKKKGSSKEELANVDKGNKERSKALKDEVLRKEKYYKKR